MGSGLELRSVKRGYEARAVAFCHQPVSLLLKVNAADNKQSHATKLDANCEKRRHRK